MKWGGAPALFGVLAVAGVFGVKLYFATKPTVSSGRSPGSRWRLNAIPPTSRLPWRSKRTIGSPAPSRPSSGDACPAGDVSVTKPGTIVLKPFGNGGAPNQVVPPSNDRWNPSQVSVVCGTIR